MTERELNNLNNEVIGVRTDLGELGDLISQLLDEHKKTNRLLQNIHAQQKVTQDEIQGSIASYGCNH